MDKLGLYDMGRRREDNDSGDDMYTEEYSDEVIDGIEANKKKNI